MQLLSNRDVLVRGGCDSMHQMFSRDVVMGHWGDLFDWVYKLRGRKVLLRGGCDSSVRLHRLLNGECVIRDSGDLFDGVYHQRPEFSLVV